MGAEQETEVGIIGGGSAAISAARVLSRAGVKTTLIERSRLGGDCLWKGCIPSKQMLKIAEMDHLVREARVFGINYGDAEVDYQVFIDSREQIKEDLSKGLTLPRVEILQGEARFFDPYHLEIHSEGNRQKLKFRKLIIATGSKPSRPPIPGINLERVIDSDGAFALEKSPKGKRVVIMGGGAVGVEWADILRGLGAEVDIVEMASQLVPTEGADAAQVLQDEFSKKGIRSHTGTKVKEIRQITNALLVVAQTAGEEGVKSFEADLVLVATGRTSNLEGLDLEKAGVILENGRIKTDDHMRTNKSHIFAAGDVTGRVPLAHSAARQGQVTAEAILGLRSTFKDNEIPSAIFTYPEVAHIGISPEDARKQGLSIVEGKFEFSKLGRAVTSGETAGFVKVIARVDTGVVIAVEAVGAHASDIVNEASLAMRLRASLKDLTDAVTIHPTFTEALAEAAWVARLRREVRIRR